VIKPTAPVFISPPGVPDASDLQRAAEILNAGTRVVMLVGAGALGARDDILRVADLLASPIIKTLPGKAAVPDRDPFVLGGIGLLGTAPAEEAIEQCDTLFMVGTNFPYTKHLPEPGQAKVVQIEVDPIRAGNRIATDVPLIGDATKTLAALAPLLEHKEDRSFLEAGQKEMADWRERMGALESIEHDPIQPQHLVRVLDQLAADDAIFTSDSGTIATWAARHFDIRAGRAFYLSGNLASMAPGLPYAIAAQVAHPGRQCIAFVGDGGLAMLMAEFATACRYHLPVKVIVNNNGELGQILWEQLVLGYPEFGIRFGQRLDFAPWAEACGGLGIRVDKRDELEDAISRALAAQGPSLVDVTVNPDEPPMPGKVTYEQAKGFAKAFLVGQPRRATIASTLFRDKLSELKT
jgi:pyruvate dehydrogenase (quinone)/pyruvate oxidase